MGGSTPAEGEAGYRGTCRAAPRRARPPPSFNTRYNTGSVDAFVRGAPDGVVRGAPAAG